MFSKRNFNNFQRPGHLRFRKSPVYKGGCDDSVPLETQPAATAFWDSTQVFMCVVTPALLKCCCLRQPCRWVSDSTLFYLIKRCVAFFYQLQSNTSYQTGLIVNHALKIAFHYQLEIYFHSRSLTLYFPQLFKWGRVTLLLGIPWYVFATTVLKLCQQWNMEVSPVNISYLYECTLCQAKCLTHSKTTTE